MIKSRLLFLLLLISSMHMLTHCSPLQPLPNPPESVFTLTMTGDERSDHVKPTVQAQQNKTTLLVTLPRAHPIYRTKAMIYNKNDHEIQQFAKHRWIDQPAKMLQPLLVQVMIAQPKFFTVVASPFAGRIDYRLDTELIDFKQEFQGDHSDFRVTLLVHVVEVQSQRVIASRQFSQVKRTQNPDPKAGVYAANIAVADLLKDVRDFVSQNG